MEMSQDELNGRLVALEDQRNTFANQVVLLNGICSVNNARIKKLEEELKLLKEIAPQVTQD